MALDDADPFDALADGSNEIEFDADQLEAAAQRPLEGPADSDLELDADGAEIGAETTSNVAAGYEMEIELDGVDAADALDALDALDEADLESLAALADDEAVATVEDEPEAITQRRVAATEDVFGAPGSDLSLFDDDDDEV
jgi:hypothetical protein